jgi:hypothetical protein
MAKDNAAAALESMTDNQMEDTDSAGASKTTAMKFDLEDKVRYPLSRSDGRHGYIFSWEQGYA